MSELGITEEDVIEAKEFEAAQIMTDIENKECGDLKNALFVAASKGYVQVAQFLASSGTVDVNGRDKKGWTALHAASYWDCVEVIKILVQNGANLEAESEEGKRPIDVAVSKSTESLLRGETKRRQKNTSNSCCSIRTRAEKSQAQCQLVGTGQHDPPPSVLDPAAQAKGRWGQHFAPGHARGGPACPSHCVFGTDCF